MNTYNRQIERIMTSIGDARVRLARRRAWERSMRVMLVFALLAVGPLAWAVSRRASPAANRTAAEPQRGAESILLASGAVTDDALIQAALESNNRSSK
jgi:hypothetical protein